MPELTPEGLRIADNLAGRYAVSRNAVLTLFDAVANGHGTQAQFYHPDLGGMGQWSHGGMVMIGDMFNQRLKDKVANLCSEIAGLLRNQALFTPPAASQSQSQSQGQGQGLGQAGVSLFVPGVSSSWWPIELGAPASVGSQNDLRYAYFPATRRLAIEQGGRVSVYDTGDHSISGFSQQQSGDQSLTFTSQFGLVRVADLPQVTPNATPSETPSETQRQPAASDASSVLAFLASSPAATPAPEQAASETAITPAREPVAGEPAIPSAPEPAADEVLVTSAPELAVSEPAFAAAPEPAADETMIILAFEPAADETLIAPAPEPAADETLIAPASEPAAEETMIILALEPAADEAMIILVPELAADEPEIAAAPELAASGTEIPLAESPMSAPMPDTTPSPAPRSAPAGDDLLSLIERLADLRRKNILTDEEFAAKKTELLGRL
ncbi:MAG: hypothetical protein ACLPID_03330 [Beijerinckiaceae bacterium]